VNGNPPALFALASAGALLLAGCQEKGSHPATEVTYNCAANAGEIQQLQSAIPAFRDSTGITLTLQPFTGQEKLYAMMAAGQAPDIFYTNTVVRDRLAAEGRLLDLRSIAGNDGFLSRLRTDVLAMGTAADSGLYSIGNWTFTAGVYFNKDLFDEEGIPYPDTTWTWESMVGIARRLARHDGTERYGIFIGSHFTELLEQMNGANLPRSALLLTLSPESLEAYRAYVALMEEGLMPDLRRVQAMGMQSVQLLQGKRVGMLVEAVPHQTLFEALDMRWGIAPLPRFGRKPVRYFRSASGGLSMSAESRNPAAAWTAMKWIIAGAPVYQPNPVLRDVDFVAGWEQRYPRLAHSGFREVWQWSLNHGAGDPRLFVRFSSWTSTTILERLQPLLDRVWARSIRVDDLRLAVPEINAAVRAELERTVRRKDLGERFVHDIQHQLDILDHEPGL
jgi:multiple sugar transport system substrate-binding protein